MVRTPCQVLVVCAVLVVSTLVGRSALAVPYQWNASQIQGLFDATASFHSGGAPQLSTINSITAIPNGVELGVTFRVGQDTDPFGPEYGRTFARVSLMGNLGSPGLDLSAFTSSELKITTTTEITAQSFLETDFVENGTTIDDGDANVGEAFIFLFWEHNDGVATGGPTPVDFDFSSGSEFSSQWNLANPQPVQGTNATRAWGLQLAKFSGIVLGQPVNATIKLEGVVPEPSTAALATIGLLAGLAVARRRKYIGATPRKKV